MVATSSRTGWNLLAELDGEDGVLRTCAWGLDLSGSEQGAGGVGGLVFEYLAKTDTAHHLFYDGNGNVTSLRDDGGALSCAYAYGPFGETLTARGDEGALAYNAFKFSTKYTDAESGLLYYGYRYYNPGTGRWLNRDPLEEQGGASLVVFASNNPTTLVDLLGLIDDPMLDKPGSGECKESSSVSTRDRNRRVRDRMRDRNRRFGGIAFDDRGWEILAHWLDGSGAPMLRRNGVWGDYMKANELLPPQLTAEIEADARQRTASGPIDITIHAEIDNGYTTGWEMLHGSNALVGDFTIRGEAEVCDSCGEGRLITYKLNYGWHDKIDKNDDYPRDTILAGLLSVFAPKDYDIHIWWNEKAEVRVKERRILEKRGYPFEETSLK